MSEIWAVITSGGITPASAEKSVFAAGRLLKQSGIPLTAVLPGICPPAAYDYSVLGADKEIFLPSERNDPGAAAFLLYRLALERAPAIILLPANQPGQEIAARLTAKLRINLMQGCTALEIKPPFDVFTWVRPCMSGQILELRRSNLTLPQLATVAASPFWNIDFVQEPQQIRSLSRTFLLDHAILPPALLSQTKKAAVDLENAEIIVAGGRGLGNAEGFQMLQKLAELLNGAVGASRAAVDAGWIDHNHQIGQSGKSTAPRVYIACGISGSIQHQAGIRNARHIVAVNTDASAPIFRIADYGIVGDLYAIVPALIEALQKDRGRNGVSSLTGYLAGADFPDEIQQM